MVDDVPKQHPISYLRNLLRVCHSLNIVASRKRRHESHDGLTRGIQDTAVFGSCTLLDHGVNASVQFA